MINILVSNKIYIKNPPEDVKNLVKRSLTLPNPVYQVMLRKHNIRALYAVKKDFKYYRENKELGLLVIGRGCENRLKRRYGDNLNISYKVTNTRLSKPFKSKGLVLRPYQVGVAEEILKNENGIIRLSVAFGKTIIACKLIELSKSKTLIIVPRNLILDQFKETLKKYYNYSPGIIQGNKFNIKDITIASTSTLANRDLDKIKNEFGMILVDECHQFITDIRLKTLQKFNPKRLYGMSGTIERDDQQGEAIKFTFGDVIVDQELPQEVPTVHRIKTNIQIEVSTEYHEMIDDMINNEERNLIIKKIAEKEIYKGRKVLILCKRIAHGKMIKELLNKDIKAFQLDSTQKDKEELFRGFRKNYNTFNVIIGTFSLLSTGVNLEILSSLIIAGDCKSKLLTTQGTGRCLRTMLNKPDVNIWDLVDNMNGILNRHGLGRRQVYLGNNWKVLDNRIKNNWEMIN